MFLNQYQETINKTYDYISYFQVFYVINTRDIKSVL